MGASQRALVAAPVFDDGGTGIVAVLLVVHRVGQTFSEEERVMIEQFAREGGKEFRQCTMFDASWRSQQLLQRFLRFTPVVGNSPDFLAILRLLTEMISNVVNVSQVSNRGVSPVSAICGDTSVAGRGLLANMWRHLCCRSGSFSWTARRWTCGCCTRSVSSPPRCMYLY